MLTGLRREEECGGGVLAGPFGWDLSRAPLKSSCEAG